MLSKSHAMCMVPELPTVPVVLYREGQHLVNNDGVVPYPWSIQCLGPWSKKPVAEIYCVSSGTVVHPSSS